MTQGFKEQLTQKLAQKKVVDRMLREEIAVTKNIEEDIISENRRLFESNITPIVEEIVCPTLEAFKDVVAIFYDPGSLIKSDSSISSSERGSVSARTTLKFDCDFYINTGSLIHFTKGDPEFTQDSEETLNYEPMVLSIIVSPEIITVKAGEEVKSAVSRVRGGPPRFERKIDIAGKNFEEIRILVEEEVSVFAVDKFSSMGCGLWTHSDNYDENFYSD